MNSSEVLALMLAAEDDLAKKGDPEFQKIVEAQTNAAKKMGMPTPEELLRPKAGSEQAGDQVEDQVEQTNEKPNKPTKSNIEEKISKQKEEVDDDINDLPDAFNNYTESQNSLGIIDQTAEKQAKVLAAGTRMVAAYTKLGIYKFADIISDIVKRGYQISEDLLSAIKKAYGAFLIENDIEGLDDVRTVRSFNIDDLNKETETAAPKKTAVQMDLFEFADHVANNNDKKDGESQEITNLSTNTKNQTTMSGRNEEVKRRVIAWEDENGKKLEDCTEAEWIEATQEILARTKMEAEEYLTYLQGINQSLNSEKKRQPKYYVIPDEECNPEWIIDGPGSEAHYNRIDPSSRKAKWDYKCLYRLKVVLRQETV